MEIRCKTPQSLLHSPPSAVCQYELLVMAAVIQNPWALPGRRSERSAQAHALMCMIILLGHLNTSKPGFENKNCIDHDAVIQ